MRRLNALLLRSGTRQECQPSPLLFNIAKYVSATAVWEKWWGSGLQIKKEEYKIVYSQITDIYVENPLRKSTKDKHTVELINEFNNITGYKSNIKKINCVSIHKQQRYWDL